MPEAHEGVRPTHLTRSLDPLTKGSRRGQTYTFDKMAGLTEAKDNYFLGKLGPTEGSDLHI